MSGGVGPEGQLDTAEERLSGNVLTTDEGTVASLTTTVAGKVAKATATTKGDLLVASGSATLVRRGVGSNGQVLTADSTQTDGVKWGGAGTTFSVSAAATTPGTVVKKLQVFDASGASLGYVAVYDAIT